MSDDLSPNLTAAAAAPAKPKAKRAPTKKAASPASAVAAAPAEAAPAPKKAAAKKVAAKKVAAKKTAATAAVPPAPLAPPTPPSRPTEPPAPKRVVRKSKTDALLPAPVAATPAPTQPELPFQDATAPAKPRRAAPTKRKTAEPSSDAPPPPTAPAPVQEAPAPQSPPPPAAAPSQANDAPRENRFSGRRNDRFGNRDRDRNRNSDRQRNDHQDRPHRDRPAPTDGPSSNATSNESRPTNQGSDQPPQSGQESASQQEESNRSRRWKERRNRFKKWKERRRNGGEGSSDAPEGDAPSGQGNEAPPAPIVLGPPEPADGILELTPKGYGFLRQRSRAFAQFAQDPFVSPELIRQYGLREGMFVKGQACKAPRGPQVTEISEVNNRHPDAMRDLPLFEELKAINPNKRIQLETDKNRLTTRVIDMFTPVGRGQRGLIVAPPRTGKTTLLQHIAEAITANHPGLHLMILLVDERPEEVTEFKRTLPNAEIFASSNDQDVKSHTRISQFAIERAKRLVECGEHVFILMDSITRLARAFNNAKSGGATMSGGVGVGALEIPRRLFAAARNTREAGSLTILATALIETGSRMDDLIFQEFKGTGNMELVLDRKIAEQFYYPAVNIFKSGTRREELLLQSFQLDKIHMLRRGLAGHKPIEALQRVLSLLERYPSNAQMLVDLPSKS
jgi:transcription termination factor Rho